MKNHLRANLWLLLLSVGVCCVLYPAALWLFANVFFPTKAGGSLITEKVDGKDVVRGSPLIAQPFTKDWYFQPRPSAASYNATTSGGSNWGANNPKLRDRVARQLGPIVKYKQDGPKKDDSVQKDIEKWYAGYKPATDEPSLMVKWAKDYPTLATAWIKGDAKPAVIEWLRGHPKILEEWKESKLEALKKTDPDAKVTEPDLSDDKTIPFDDIATAFFESVAATEAYASKWLEPEEFDTGEKDDKGEAVKGKRFKPVTEGSDLQATLFDLWLQANAKPDLLEKVPADMVMASGSGLDPHITLRNAMTVYQIDRVVSARAEKTGRSPNEVRTKVEEILKANAFTPLSGLIGEPLINVLEVNMAMDFDIPLPK